MGDFPSAKACYERTVDYVTRPAHLHTVYLRLADIYLREHQVCVVNTTGYILAVLILLPSLPSVILSTPPPLPPSQYDKAKTTFLHACRTSPSSMTWRGVGISCYKVANRKHCSIRYTSLYVVTLVHTVYCTA